MQFTGRLRYKTGFLYKDHTNYSDPLVSSQFRFYQDGGNLATDDYPFAETVFEKSPLKRVVKQGASGGAWQPDANNDYSSQDRTIKNAYETNQPNEVLLWTYIEPTSALPMGLISSGTSSPSYYSPNELYMNKVRDEHNNQVIEYVDKKGVTVLKRVQTVTGDPSTLDSNKDTNYASTYYIYDDFGNLVCVLPPEATKQITQTTPPSEFFGKSDAQKDDFLKRWAFRYSYDSRRRMIYKQVPGADQVYLAYDKRDRLVMTQDGNQRPQKRWLFTKYDALDRPVLTGIHVADSSLTQEKMQRRINQFYDALQSNGGAWYETFSGAFDGVHGYDNKSYPRELVHGNYLSVTYYDNYKFKSTLPDSSVYSFRSDELDGQVNTYFRRLAGKVTGSKIKILNGGVAGYTWLNSVNYYDERGRLIQAASDNHKNGIDVITNVYDFVGRVLGTSTNHKNNELHWKDLVGATWLADKMIRTASSSGWGSSGAASVELLPANEDGWFEFAAPATNASIMVGFSPSNTNANWTSIRYALYLVNNGTLQVREAGGSTNYLGSGFTYKAGDIFRLERRNGKIKYYQNGKLILERVSITNALLIDLSINTTAGQIAGFRSSFGTPRLEQITRTFDYDHAGRLLKTYHQLNDRPKVLLANNSYNELGQLVTKKLHSTDGGEIPEEQIVFKQHVDYRYNIRGWVTRINNADLSPDGANDPYDYFGMTLHYNDQAAGIGNTPYFNGNISAIEWSTDLGLGIADLGESSQRAYSYSYDPMNRLKMATHFQKISLWQTSSSYSEEIPEYDLNGNIRRLNRKGNGGINMDELTYNYGTGTTASNKLLAVNDAGDRTDGFTEVATTATDYVYDGNGNLVWDRNKGGTECLQNGDFSGGGANWAATGATGRLTFINDEVQIAAGTATTTIAQSGIISSRPYVVVIELERTAGSLTINLGGATSTLASTGTFAIAMTAGTSHNQFRIIAATTFVGKVKSASVKGVAVITYNYLNLPETVNKAGDSQLHYIYDAGGRKLAQELSKNSQRKKRTDYAGEFVYENDSLKFIHHEEGRITTENEAVYDYVLRDHLGNTRITFTTKPESDTLKATLEDDTRQYEENAFGNYNSFVNLSLNHTPEGERVHILNGGYAGQVGLAKTFAVVPGDTIRARVYAKTSGQPGVNGNLANFASAILTAFNLSSPGPGENSSAYDAVNSFGSWIAGGNRPDRDTLPKGFINILVFNKDFELMDLAFDQLSSNSTTHQLMSAESIIRQAGYVYVFLSNEGDKELQIGFDDYEVIHSKSPVIQGTDYYPFGLTFNSYQRENSIPNVYQYNGKEKQDELDLGWLDYGARMYLPELGRWKAIDKRTDEFQGASPYSYCINNPLIFVDPDGEAWKPIIDADGNYTGFEWIPESESYDEDGNLKEGLYETAILIADNGTWTSGESSDKKQRLESYNVGSATVTVYSSETVVDENGNKVVVGKKSSFEGTSMPSDPSKFGTVAPGLFESVRHKHGGKNGYWALQIRTLDGSVNLPAVGTNPATGKSYVSGANIHKAGKNDYTGTFWREGKFNRHGDVDGKMFAHRYSGVSEGCQLIKAAQWDSFMSNFPAQVGKIGTIISRGNYTTKPSSFQNPDKEKIDKYLSNQD